MSSNNQKNYGKDISSINTPIKFHLPDGSTQSFNNSQEAQAWFNKNYPDGYSITEYTPTQGDSDHPIELGEVVIIADSAPKKPTSSKKGTNYSQRFNTHFYGTSDFDALFGRSRVEGVKKAWQRNPQAMQNWTDGNNAASIFITAPFAAYAAGEYVLPWLAENAASYLTARGWLGATQATGSTPAWLTPTTATAIDATLAGSATGASINDMRENGPTVGNVLGTILGVGGLAYEAIPTIMEGYQAGKRAYDVNRFGRQLNQAAKLFDGTVRPEYFNSSSNWYRFTEFPEIAGIQEHGMNITTRDINPATSQIEEFRQFILNTKAKPGTGENEGYWFVPRKKTISLSKRGAAHGNTSQAAKGEIWQGTFANSGLFPKYVIEGEGPSQVFRGFNPATGADSRTNFVKVPWEEVPFGSRIGFHTGEMPMEGLRAFRMLPNGRIKYEGPILPNRTVRMEAQPKKYSMYDPDFEQYARNLSITPTKINNEAQRYYDRVVQPLLKTDRPLFNDYNQRAIILDEVPGEPGYVSGVHYSDTGENIISRKGDPISSGIHEVVSHGTDDIIPYEFVQEYEDLVDGLLNKYYGPVPEGSETVAEFRATMNEVRKQLQKYWLKKGKVDLTEIDKVSDEELMKLMRSANGYGATYQRAYKQLPESQQSEWMSRFRKALKTLPITGGVFISTQNNEEN